MILKHLNMKLLSSPPCFIRLFFSQLQQKSHFSTLIVPCVSSFSGLRIFPTVLTHGRALKIYTKTGDGGTSSLFTGERRPKFDAVFETLGDIDELNCNIGLAREVLMESRQQENFKELNEMLQKVQCALQDVASCVATPLTTASEKQIARTEFDKDLVVEMEEWIDKFTEDLPELKNFILPSGGRGSCSLHVTRSICRRAERKVASRFIQNDVDEPVAKYINRLSDFLFTLARYVAFMEGHPEVIYKKPRRKKKLVDAKLTTTDSDNDKETKD